MRAALLTEIKKPLVLKEIAKPHPKKNEVLIRVISCAICRTDLHIIDGDLPTPTLPLILGHQIVGVIEEKGDGVQNFEVGDKVGIPWLGHTCGACFYCQHEMENLCENGAFTGYTRPGGFAQYSLADYRYIFPLPPQYNDVEMAPLLCAGLIGYRALKKTKNCKKVGFYGFGNSARILLQIAPLLKKEIIVFTRKGDFKKQQLALSLGAKKALDSDEKTETLDAAIVFADDGSLIPLALDNVRKGGIVISSAIHMSPIPSFSYTLLWGEKTLTTVANLTREDGEEFFHLASSISLKVPTTSYPLEKINDALDEMRKGMLTTAVITL